MYTVAAWGAHGRLLDRGAIVGGLDQPSVWGRRGEPRHPLYVPRVTEPTAYKTKDDGDRPAEGFDHPDQSVRSAGAPWLRPATAKE